MQEDLYSLKGDVHQRFISHAVTEKRSFGVDATSLRLPLWTRREGVMAGNTANHKIEVRGSNALAPPVVVCRRVVAGCVGAS
jgi:hypothetical protein